MLKQSVEGGHGRGLEGAMGVAVESRRNGKSKMVRPWSLDDIDLTSAVENRAGLISIWAPCLKMAATQRV